MPNREPDREAERPQPFGGLRKTRSPLAIVLLGGITGYRWIFSGRPSPCRFDPTCSQYGLDAIRDHGAVRGGWLTLKRLGRCRPGGGLGFDPVPSPAVRQKPRA